MKTPPITKKQFIGWSVVFTIGMAFWLSSIFWRIGLLIITFGNLLLISRDERRRSVPAREMIWIFAGLALLVVAGVASKHWLPEDSGASVKRIFHHPAFVISFWIFGVWLNYRRYQITYKSDADVA